MVSHLSLRVLACAALVATAAGVTGCGSSKDACADTKKTIAYFQTDAPENKAMADAAMKQYKDGGDTKDFEAARTAYVAAYGKALRTDAAEAKSAGVRDAVTKLADATAANGDITDALQRFETACP